MSTTVPLTLIEGSMALPSLAPLGHLLPPPFGRDWALLPPEHSVRAELNALYAAVLRTFCVDRATLRALCQWEPVRKPPAASAGFPAPDTSITVFDAPLDESLQPSAESAVFSPVSAPAAPASTGGKSMRWGVLAGGACALGGAAILAWIGFGHLAQRHTPVGVKPAGDVPLSQPVQLANRHTPDASVPPGDLTPAPATGIVTPIKATPARATAGKTVSRRPDKQRKGAVNRQERNARSSPITVVTRMPGLSPMSEDMPRFGVPAQAQRKSPAPSSAGPYSPIAPSQLGTSEYKLTTLSAGTHLRDIAPPSRPALPIDPSGNSGTEWNNHMSQRRVTDIPDQFVK
jgi:hypothetical protein